MAAVSTQLLGPFRVNFDDAGLEAGITLDTLDAGTWLVGVAVVGITDLDGGQGTVDFSISIEGLPGWHTTDAGALGTTEGALGTPAGEDFTFATVGVQGASGNLMASLSTQNPTTQGAWDIYAFVVAP